MTFALALAAAVLSAASLVLHVVAPKTKTTFDDKVAKYIDDALAKLKS
jgi:hypothetical protein